MWTKFKLFSLLAVDGVVEVEIKGIVGIVCSIERESGCGHSFNVTLNTKSGKKIVHVRTMD